MVRQPSFDPHPLGHTCRVCAPVVNGPKGLCPRCGDPLDSFMHTWKPPAPGEAQRVDCYRERAHP